MKKFVIGLSALCLMLSGCSDTLYSGGERYSPYGLINEQTQKRDNMCYEIPAANIIVGIILIETVFVPIYIVGWDLYSPTKEKVNGKCN